MVANCNPLILLDPHDYSQGRVDKVKTNRLIHEQSPYLLQHAHNPVDWFPWGEEAQNLAREQEIPIFLSIGYSACHWCHVMEHECFMDEEVAELLNRHFISIKVDREEHPEIDRIYMNVAQVMTGSGGWPLSMFLTPELKPFYAATFIPKKTRGNIPGMLDLIPHVVRVWREHHDEVIKAGEKVFELISQASSPEKTFEQPGMIPDDLIHLAYQSLARSYDPEYGGFGRAPKFPSVPQLTFLMQYGVGFQNTQAIKMALMTLSSMARGGIRDQVGLGFHRYATDRAWNIPHFEKMLYDQALNANAYTSAWQITRDPLMREAAEDCMRYICRTLRLPEGGFGSAEDADSPGGEGAFYLWQSSELREILSSEEYAFTEQIWGITKQGNVSPGAGVPAGKNIITWIRETRPGEKEDFSQDRRHQQMVDQIRKKLFEARERRPRPPRDDKVLTDWNGLTIEALATTGRILDREWMIHGAEKAATFLLTMMVSGEGTILHRWRNGMAAIDGTAQDYVSLASGLVHLFQATGNPEFLKSATKIVEVTTVFFGDKIQGGYYATRIGDTAVPVRLRDDQDGAVPSVNGQAYKLLRILAVITGIEEYTDQAERLIKGMSGIARESPLGVLSLLEAVCRDKKDIRAVITGEVSDPRRKALWKALNREYLPGLVIIPIIPSFIPGLLDLVPGTGTYVRDDGPAVWICAKQTCSPPVTEPGILSDLLKQITHS